MVRKMIIPTIGFVFEVRFFEIKTFLIRTPFFSYKIDSPNSILLFNPEIITPKAKSHRL
jgi:hypothetical protein